MRKKVGWTKTWALQGLQKELNKHVFTRQNRQPLNVYCQCKSVTEAVCVLAYSIRRVSYT